MKKTLIKNGWIVTHNKTREHFVGDLLVEKNKIKKISKKSITPDKTTQVIDASNCYVIPGLIQTHTHLCQVLFRGEADDLSLISWLKRKIWPYEHAHNKKSIQASAELACLEMMMTGTTSILDMGTVQHTQALLESVEEVGIRYWGGKCLMDKKASSGPLYESTDRALQETEDLMNEWQGKNSLVQHVLCPRFVVSCSEALLKEIAEMQKSWNTLVHIHASESLEEIALVKKQTGFENIDYLDRLQLLNRRTAVVHGVHVKPNELKKMVKNKTPLVHCPSSNLKLASGIAPVLHYLKHGLCVGLGSDGAPCNNSMDAFKEMHLAALLQKAITHDPTSLPAVQAFDMATMGGAKLLGMQDELGSLEVGKLADIAIVDRSHPSVFSVQDPYSALVYSCSGRDVRHVLINGRLVIKNSSPTFLDAEYIKSKALLEKKLLLKRA